MPSINSAIRNQVKAEIIRQGWTITKVVQQMNELHPERKRTTVQNLSNKLARGTIKYSEVVEIAEIIGVSIVWK